jgi:HK97 family phage portal protein
MGLLTGLKNFLAPTDTSDSLVSSSVGLIGTSSPPAVNSKQLLALVVRSPELLNVVYTVAQSFADVEWTVKRNGKQLDSHDLLDLLNKPNDVMGGYAFRELSQAYIDVLGESLDILEFNSKGQPRAIYPIPPVWATAEERNGRYVWIVRMHGTEHVFDESRVDYAKRLHLVDPYGRGLGLGMSLTDEIETLEYADKRTKAYFFNDGTPRAIVSMPKQTPAEVARLEEGWASRFQGFRKAFRMAFINSEMTVHRLDTNPNEIPMIELSEHKSDIIRRLYNVPPEIVGKLESSNRATAQEAERIFVKRCLRPRLKFKRDQWNTSLVPFFGEDLELGYISPDPADHDFRRSVMVSVPWCFTRNEFRELAGHEPRRDGNVYMQPPFQELTPAGAIDNKGLLPPAATLKALPESAKILFGPASSEAPKMAGPGAMVNKSAYEQARAISESLRPERLRLNLTPAVAEAIKEIGQEVMRDLGTELSFNMLNPFVHTFLGEFGAERVTAMNQTSKDLVTSVIMRGFEEGLSAREVKSLLRGQFEDMSSWRAQTIARTEMTRAANFGTHNAYVQSGLVKARVWISTADPATRPEHAASASEGGLNGQVKPIDQPFEILAGPDTGASGMYPGDFGIGSQDINCRCTVGVVLTDEQRGYIPMGKEQAAAQWKLFDERATRLEVAFGPVVRLTLLQQMNAELLPAFDSVFGTRGE